MEWISINHGHHSVQLILHPDRKPLYGWKWKILDCRLCHGIQLLMHQPAQERTTGEELQWLVIISTAPSSSPGRPLLPSIIICYDYPGLNKAFYVRSVFLHPLPVPTHASSALLLLSVVVVGWWCCYGPLAALMAGRRRCDDDCCRMEKEGDGPEVAAEEPHTPFIVKLQMSVNSWRGRNPV